MLPDGDGFSLMEQIRTWTDIPVIFLTARDEAADAHGRSGCFHSQKDCRPIEPRRVCPLSQYGPHSSPEFLGLGADDYIAKPFLPQEFLLRVYAVLRRCYKEDAPILKLDSCTVDFSRAEVDKTGKMENQCKGKKGEKIF